MDLGLRSFLSAVAHSVQHPGLSVTFRPLKGVMPPDETDCILPVSLKTAKE